MAYERRNDKRNHKKSSMSREKYIQLLAEAVYDNQGT